MHDLDNPIDARRVLKLIVLNDNSITTEQLQTKLKRHGIVLTAIAVSSMRRQFLSDLHVLEQEGWLRACRKK